MARTKKDIYFEMCAKNWGGQEEYKDCLRNLRISKIKKHIMSPAWLLFLIVAAYYDCPAWLMVLTSIPVILYIAKINNDLDHKIKVSTLAMFCLEIEFGASKTSDEPDMTEELIHLFRE